MAVPYPCFVQPGPPPWWPEELCVWSQSSAWPQRAAFGRLLGPTACTPGRAAPPSAAHAGRRWAPAHALQLPPPAPCPGVCGGRGRRRSPPRLCPARRASSFASVSIELTVPIVNQELRKIFKIKSETTDMYKRVMIMPGSFFISHSCSIMFVYFRVEMVLEIHDQNKHTGSCS